MDLQQLDIPQEEILNIEQYVKTHDTTVESIVREFLMSKAKIMKQEKFSIENAGLLGSLSQYADQSLWHKEESALEEGIIANYKTDRY